MTTQSSILENILENPICRGAWWPTVNWVAESRTRLKPLSSHKRAHPEYIKNSYNLTKRQTTLF